MADPKDALKEQMERMKHIQDTAKQIGKNLREAKVQKESQDQLKS